jgi:hypothetical protein
MKHPILKSGLFRWSNTSDNIVSVKGELPLIKWLKRSLGFLNVPYADPCCDLNPTNPVPMRFNPSSSTTEYFDVANQVWVTTPSPCFAWAIYNDSGAPVDVDYTDCDGDAQTITVADGDDASIAGFNIIAPNVTGVYVTFLGLD